MTDWVTSFLLLEGAAFMLVAALGLVRFPDLFTRMQAAAKAGSLGVGLVVAAVATHFADGAVTVHAALVAAFFLLTAPVAAHLIARAAHLSGSPVWGASVDELRGSAGADPPGREGPARDGSTGRVPAPRRRPAESP